MTLLVLDTATVDRAAVVVAAGSVLASADWSAGALDEDEALRRLLHEHPPEAIAAGSGPGGFTSVRRGLAFALGAAWARRVPLLTFSSLRALSLRLESPDAAAAMDGGAGLAYVGLYGSAPAEEVLSWEDVSARAGALPLAVAATSARRPPPLRSTAELRPLSHALVRLAGVDGALKRVGYDELRPTYLQEPAAIRSVGGRRAGG